MMTPPRPTIPPLMDVGTLSLTATITPTTCTPTATATCFLFHLDDGYQRFLHVSLSSVTSANTANVFLSAWAALSGSPSDIIYD